MSEWRPIETAPVDRVVRVGFWNDGALGLHWVSYSAVVYRRDWLGRRVRTYSSRKFSHWTEFPPPPEVEAVQ